ncbi:MAG: type IX secretion system membrane protein PorP/SprF [Flavobacteriales bacterium]|nr:type IX secretion system membrane protein PorP/SprF [Flavobacteriales bacterium]MDG1781500.1 type IX secretion system membrane protein PorP/SprF [Flavobacteriales bacterium]MDG2246077.1 type IX secretion system membrane protein PorP/SprF [Flavobacteriales bacterium]
MKRILVLLIAFLGTFSMNAQQELMVSQYMFNGLLVNPAYAGTHDYFSASLLHRSQWTNLDGAPTSQVFAIDGPIANNKLGVGLLINNDQIGVISQLDLSANLAYHLELGTGDLSFGIKAGGAMYSATLSDVVVWDENDQVYSANDISGKFVPKFGFGVYYHSEKFFAGVSVPVIYSMDDNVILQGSTADNYFSQHYYVNTGMVFEPNTNLAIKPSILVKYEQAAPLEVDLNCNFLLYRRLWLGAGYRTGDAIIGMIEYNITPQLRAGYSYDFTTTEIRDYSNGSHEIMLGFDFGKDVEIKKRSPRYF